VVTEGAGLAGSREIAEAKWIRVRPVKDTVSLSSEQKRSGLGIGELSAIALSQSLAADLLLIDDAKARKKAQEAGLAVLGSVGVLRHAFELGLLTDLNNAYRQLLAAGAYVDRAILERSLQILKLPPL
jgi:predicted nucleic acid-binding protein